MLCDNSRVKTANSTTRTNTKTAVGSVPTSTGGTVRFGSAVVFAMPLTKAQLKRNVDAASKALVRAAAQIIKAGIQLQVGKKTPRIPCA